MPQEFKTTGEPLGESKMGTKVTYHGDERSPEVDVIFGVPMKKGSSVDLAETYGEEQAKKYLRKLAGNPQFEVEGVERAKPKETSQRADPSTTRLLGEQVGYARVNAQLKGQEPPEGYDAPLKETLEQQGGRPPPPPKPQEEEESTSRRAPTPRK
jgi:hypothetical protein